MPIGIADTLSAQAFQQRVAGVIRANIPRVIVDP